MPDNSTTGTLHSSQVPMGVMGIGNNSIRKSFVASSTTSRGGGPGGFIVQGQQHNSLLQHNNTSANLAAGLNIANATLPMGPA